MHFAYKEGLLLPRTSVGSSVGMVTIPHTYGFVYFTLGFCGFLWLWLMVKSVF